jgi:outer membrane lipoprotein SlyB
MKNSTLYKVIAMSALALAGTSVANAQTANNGLLEREDGVYLRCAMCGTIESITQNVGNQSGGSAGATIAGSVVGGLVGNRVGGGRGRRAATVAGVAAGGAIGNQASAANQPARSTVRVNLGRGSFINVSVDDASELRVGDMVEVDSNGNVTRLR